MSDTAIRLENLSKNFGWRGRIQAVQGLNLDIKAGQVYGFLGPNGAGKTTTIRMLLDLIRPTQGHVYLFGQQVQRQRGVLKRVGAQVEGAMFYNFLTGRRNLEVLALTANLDVPSQEIDRLLQQVGMLSRSRRAVNGYSTGMKQRLGLAATLLGNPDLIILDEPTNGLDPQGIQEIRVFIRDLVDQHGKTVFLSSHLLNEVEQICDRVAIINHGQIIREGTVHDLVSAKTQLRLEAEPVEKALGVLQGHWPAEAVNGHVLINASREDAPAIVEKLVGEGIKIYEISSQRQSLEEYFLAVTQGEGTHAGKAIPG